MAEGAGSAQGGTGDRETPRWSLRQWAEAVEGEFPAEMLAAVTAVRVHRESRWIHRRTDRFTFIDGDRVRKSIELDLTVPRGVPSGEPRPADDETTRAVLPLAQPTKRFLRDIKVTDEKGHQLGWWSRDSNSLVATLILRQQAEQSVPREDTDEEAWTLLEHDFADIAGLRHHPRHYAKEDARRRSRECALKRFQEPANGGASESATDQRAGKLREDLWDDPVFRSWLRRFNDRFLMLVPGFDDEGQPRKITISYERDLDLRRDEQARKSRIPTGLARSLAVVGGLFSGRGIRGQVDLYTRGPFSAASYHAEVLVSRDLRLLSARLVQALQPAPADIDRPETLDLDLSTPRAHLFANGRRPRPIRETGQVVAEGAARCFVRVTLAVRGELLLPAITVAAGLVAVLTGGIAALCLGTEIKGTGLIAVLLGLPSLFAAFLVPRGDPLMRRLFVEVRFILYALAIIPYITAATLAVQLDNYLRVAVWSALDVLALACLLAARRAYRLAHVDDDQAVLVDGLQTRDEDFAAAPPVEVPQPGDQDERQATEQKAQPLSPLPSDASVQNNTNEGNDSTPAPPGRPQVDELAVAPVPSPSPDTLASASVGSSDPVEHSYDYEVADKRVDQVLRTLLTQADAEHVIGEGFEPKTPLADQPTAPALSSGSHAQSTSRRQRWRAGTGRAVRHAIRRRR